MISAVTCPYFRRAFGWCVPIGGLIGLGGGEFRLPVLMHGIGLVGSVLGVAGRESLVPALIPIFGADIKTAGSASILISLGVVSIGLWRFWRADAIPMGRGAHRITTAMAAGSIIGATLGGLAVAYAPVTFLKCC